MRKKNQHRSQHGSLSVEMVLLLPAFVLLIIGGLEMARGATLRMSLGAGAWRAARYLSVYAPSNDTEALNIVRDAVAHNVMGGDPAQVSVTVTDDGGRTFGHVLTVRAETDFCPVIPFMTNGCVTLEAEHALQVEVWP